MQVMFFSKSENVADHDFQRILDAIACRIESNVWLADITKDDLAMIHSQLEKTASKNTAVSCHWIRSRHTSELLWTVGRQDKFDADGHVPVNTTRRKILSHYQETGWTFMYMVQGLAAVAALLHDLGKASDYFQKKLKNRELKPDPFRHELISALLVRGMYLYYAEKGTDLFSALAAGEHPSIKDILPYCRNIAEEAKAQYRPFKGEASVSLFCVLWLILSHHRLPLPLNENGDDAGDVTFADGAHSLRELFSYITAGKTYRRSIEKDSEQSTENFKAELEQCFTFSEDLAVFSDKWRHELKKWCLRLKDISAQLEECSQSGALRSVLKYARLSLMLGDHFYSSQQADTTWQSDCRLYANTDAALGVLSQRLDEHLSGVKAAALKVAHYLPCLESELQTTDTVRELKRKAEGRFVWQDKAADAIKSFRKSHPEDSGAFILNMAGTDCGKTTANAKIMSALCKEQHKLRFTLALGLRSLTLQTGDEYRNRLKLDTDDLAVVIGSGAVQYMYEQDKKEEEKQESFNSDKVLGSESAEQLFDADTYYEGALPQEGFATLFRNKKAAQMLYAPVVCCTIDHIMGATECSRGGQYMVPFLRLMSSDLV
ncbi:MAG TPA: hypothetical protein DCR21_03530 [Succinivibrionaceae bacterium]|nr:hypothetical protein [Succinivibrionaceae bacterium]